MADRSRVFPFVQLSGSHRQIGEQLGEACGDLVRLHRDLALARLRDRSGISAERALAEALKYRPYVQEHAPFFDEEIQGLAAGAKLSLAEAYLLQLRAELAVVTKQHDAADECTSFAALPVATVDGTPLIGQNADLPSFYAELGIVAELRFDDMPAVLMLLPAGQLSYLGINDRGLGVCANYLTCDGWRYGFPRYLLSRLALTKETVNEAIGAVQSAPRASSRNLLFLDQHGTAADLETTPTDSARLDPVDGILVHANHYVSDSLRGEERSPEHYVNNSRIRQRRLDALLREHQGQLDAARMQTILRDRACRPDTLCRAPGDDPSSDTITFASLISEPTHGRISVAVGPPHEHDYRTYAFE